MNAQVNPSVEAEEVNHFAKLANVNVSQHVEKKQNMSYLSWSWAVDQLMRHDPKANWSFREPMVYPDGTMMVHCDVTAFGKSMYMFLPVMDHRNKAIQNPDAFAINKAMMRCLVKGIAVHGLGLYIYAGEDLPTGEMDNAVADWLAAIDACSTLEELKDVYMKATAAVGSNKEINAATNAKKASLK